MASLKFELEDWVKVITRAEELGYNPGEAMEALRAYRVEPVRQETIITQDECTEHA